MQIWIDLDTAVTIPVNIMPLTDNGDFKTRETAIAYDQAGMDLVWNFVTPAGVMTQTAVTPTTGGVYDWSHVGDAMYEIEIPATSEGGLISNNTEGSGWFTGLCDGVLPWRSPIFGFGPSGQYPSGSVTILPLQASASGSGRLSPNYLTAYQYAKIEATLLILDADDNPVDLSAVDLSFRAWQKDTPGTVEITMLSTGGSPELTVGGDDNNQVTIAGGVAHTADAAQYDWRLYDTTNSRAVATGTLEVEAGAEMSDA